MATMQSAFKGIISCWLIAAVTADIYFNAPQGNNNWGRAELADNDAASNPNRCHDTQTDGQGGYCPPETSWTLKANSVLAIEIAMQHGMNNKQAASQMLSLSIYREDLTGNTVMETINAAGDNLQNVNRGAYQTRGKISTEAQLPTPGASHTELGNQGRCNHDSVTAYARCYQKLNPKFLWWRSQDEIDAMEANGDVYMDRTPQNNNGASYGFQCAHTVEYYPMNWAYSEYAPVAFAVTNSSTLCPELIANSPTVKDQYTCSLLKYNNYDCEANGGTLIVKPKFTGQEEPICVEAPYMRTNFAGPSSYSDETGGLVIWNVTLPDVAKETKTFFQAVYNISCAGMGDGYVDFLTSEDNGDDSPVQNNEEGTLTTYNGVNLVLRYGLAANQCFRRFMDHSAIIKVAPDDGNSCPDGKIHNWNSGGSRGNNRQAYPRTEYNWSPEQLHIDECDCVSVNMNGCQPTPYQAGTDLYNDEGGIGDAVDIHGWCQTPGNGHQTALPFDQWTVIPEGTPNAEEVKWNYCTNCATVGQNVNNVLNGVKAYCQTGVIQHCEKGTYDFTSPRNNQFSNRDQQGQLRVGTVDSLLAVAIGIAAALIVTAVGAGLMAFYAKKKPNSFVGRLFQNGGARGSGIMNSPR